MRRRGAGRGELEGHVDAGEPRRHQRRAAGILVAADHGGDRVPARVERGLHRTAHPARADHDSSHSVAPEEFAVKALHDRGAVGLAHHEGEVGGRRALRDDLDVGRLHRAEDARRRGRGDESMPCPTTATMARPSFTVTSPSGARSRTSASSRLASSTVSETLTSLLASTSTGTSWRSNTSNSCRRKPYAPSMRGRAHVDEDGAGLPGDRPDRTIGPERRGAGERR